MPEPKETVRPQQPQRHVQESLFTETGESAEAAREEEERKRQQEKEAILAEKKAEKEAQKAAEEAKIAAAEAEKRQKAECEILIQEAIKLKDEEKFGEALKKLKKASAMNIQDMEEAIRSIEKEVKELKEKNSLTGKLSRFFGSNLDED